MYEEPKKNIRIMSHQVGTINNETENFFKNGKMKFWVWKVESLKWTISRGVQQKKAEEKTEAIWEAREKESMNMNIKLMKLSILRSRVKKIRKINKILETCGTSSGIQTKA